jgi:arylsulfatase A-like enzyme
MTASFRLFFLILLPFNSFLLSVASANGRSCVEPFADAIRQGGTSYQSGSFLFDQRNSAGNQWFPVTNTPAPPAAGFPTILPGSLSYPGLVSPAGNSVLIPSDVGVMGRLTLNFSVTRGTAYFSFLLKVTDISALNETGTEDNYFAAFGDNAGAQDATLLRAATRVLAKRSGNGFKLGVARNSNIPADWVFDQIQRNTNEIFFIVGSYNYNNHTASLWVDPPGSALASANPPPPTITAMRGADLNRNGVRSFVLGCRTNKPPACIVSGLRVGASWSFVTGGPDLETTQEHPALLPVSGVQRPRPDYRNYITDPVAAARRPNIVFILCDDMGYGDLGVLYQNSRKAGLPRETTPNLDQFAAEGMQLYQHYCPAPICAPSRASLLLGVHQGHANVRDQQFDKALEDNHTLGTVLQSAGYATAAIGKWGLGGDDLGGTSPAEWPAYPTRRGFDYFFGYERHGDGHDHYPREAPYSNHSKQCYDGATNITPALDKCYTTDLFTARAKKWITDQRQTRPDQPFFLYLAFDTPHSVYELPPQAYPRGGGLDGGLQWLGTPHHMINTASGKIDSYIYPEYSRATYDDDHNPATPEVPWPEVFQRFASSIRRIDDAVGDLKKLLRDLGIETNTLVVFTSDNGPTIEDALHLKPRYAANFFDNFGPMDGIKRDSFEGGIRMPALVRWPGTIASGTTNFSPSQFQDWMPTFTQLAGLPAPARTDGVSLVPTLTGHGAQRTSTVYVEYFDPSSMPDYAEFEPAHRKRVRNQMQVIGLNGYQGVRYDIQSPADNFEIYDVLHDPKEATNLAANPAFAALQRQMKDHVLQLRRPDNSAPRPYDGELVPASVPAAVTNGLVNYFTYEGNWPWVPDVDMMTNVSKGRAAGLSLEVRPRETNYALEFRGYIRVPSNGNYTFYLDDDAGAVLRLHEATVIDDDFTHENTEASGSILLQAGLHEFRLTYLHRSGTPKLDLKYAGVGQSKCPIPLTAFYADYPGGSPVPATGAEVVPTVPQTPSLPRAPSIPLPTIAWDSRSIGTGSVLLIHAGAVRMQVTGDWLGGTEQASSDNRWQPVSCEFDTSGRTLRMERFFEGRIDAARVYNREIGARELAGLLGQPDQASLLWRHHYFASASSDWMNDEDADGVPLWRNSAHSDGVYFADSPAFQIVPMITKEHRELCFYRRSANQHAGGYEIEASSNLTDWKSLAGAEVSSKPAADLPGFQRVIFRVAESASSQWPIHIKIRVP